MDVKSTIEEIDCDVIRPLQRTRRRNSSEVDKLNQIATKKIKFSDHDGNIINNERSNAILNDIIKLYKTEHPKIIQQFNETLIRLSQYYRSKQNDLEYRESAKAGMLQKLNGKKYKDLIDKLVIKIRNHHHEITSSDDYHSEFREYIEIAFKSNKPHKEYKTKINELLQNAFGSINESDHDWSNVVYIICDYSRNAYIWFSFDISYRADNCGNESVHGCFYNVPFDFNDHYDGKHIQEKVRFEQMKDDLNIGELNEMNGTEINHFFLDLIYGILDNTFEEWIYRSDSMKFDLVNKLMLTYYT